VYMPPPLLYGALPDKELILYKFSPFFNYNIFNNK
jgi:hypothetical protein